MTDPLDPLRADPSRAGILLDFDGTLAPIVTRPEEAGPVAGAAEVLAALAQRYRLVAVISGRPSEALDAYLPVEGVQRIGLYGLSAHAEVPVELRSRLEDVAVGVPGAWVEGKGLTMAVHYRQTPKPEEARDVLAPALIALAEEAGLDLFEGKMVFELAPAGEARKGGAVERLVHDSGVSAALYAGDDLPDLEAFAALDELARDGLHAVKVAVGGPEAPQELVKAADVLVEGPPELLELLRGLL